MVLRNDLIKEMRPIILVGGGGHCKSVIEAAESAGYTIKGILDLPQFMGNKVLDYAVIGSDDEIPLYIKNPLLRNKLHERIEAADGNLATVIASTAHVSKYATLGTGTVVLHGAMVNAGATIGKGCIINTLANIEHDVIIGDYCHISTGAMVNGDCRVGKNTFLGSQSVMVNDTSIPSNSVFAAGCLVRKSLTIEGLYAGNPAVLIKKA